MATTASNDNSQTFTLIAKWGKERLTLEGLEGSISIDTVKTRLSELSGVLPKRQKLIGLTTVSGAKVQDETLLSELKLKPAKKKGAVTSDGIVMEFIMMGTKEEHIFVDPTEKDDLPDVVDDFDLDFNAGSDEWTQHVANGENLKKFTDSTMVHVMNEPRPGKPLLVLDLDHTLLDFSRRELEQDVHGGSVLSMKRPFMDDFLTCAYKYYDLVVWSQTSWRWLETKLVELGMISHPGYKFCFVLDKTSMFTIKSFRRDGSSVEHHVKPLQIIWSKFPGWGKHNTVHVDDLSRNFALNWSSGLKIKAYYRKKSKAQRDRILQALATYLEDLAKSNTDFENVNFDEWLDVVSGQLPLTK